MLTISTSQASSLSSTHCNRGVRVAVLRAVGIRRLPVEPRGIEVLRRQQHIHTGAVRQRLDAQVVDGGRLSSGR